MIKFQNDLYIEKNDCGQKRQTIHKAFWVLTSIPEEYENQNLDIVVTSLIGFEQKIQYRRTHFFYPALFNQYGHKEFTLPTCQSKRCEFEFFIFDPASKLNQAKNIRVTIFFNKKEILKKDFHIVGLRTQNSADYFFEDLNLKQSEGVIQGNINKNRIIKLLKQNYKISIVLVHKSSPTQNQYTDEEYIIKKDHPWLTEKGDIFKFKTNRKDLTYLGLMVIASKTQESFESKIEIKNKEKIFFFCRKTKMKGEI